ncbi:hypothetical protein [Rhizobium leguminosarum]
MLYTSRAALFADLAHDANSSAWVMGDTTAAFNGVYVKSGASGSGSWSRVGDLPFSFVIATDTAGVYLPAVAANHMLVDNSAGTARESKTFPQVNDLLEKATWAFDNNTLYKSRSNKDRWLDSYRLAEELQFTGGGSTATDAAVLQALYNRAKAAGRGELILPRGDIALEAAASIYEDGTKPIRIVGQGPNQTRFLNTSASQHFFNIGSAAQSRSKDIVFEGLSLNAAVAQDNSGRGFYLRNTSDITFKDVLVDGLKNGWSLGEGASVTNDVVYTSLDNCGGNSSAASSIPLILLGSGGILQVGGNAYRWNASGGHDFMQQLDTNWNWDGLYVYGQFFEQFRKYLVSNAKGIVNAEWTGGQVDRADIFFQAEATSGSNRDWNIHDVKILGFSGQGGGIGFLSSGTVESIRIAHNTFHGLHDACVYAATGNVFVEANEMVQCTDLGASAPLGGALIRIGQGRARIQGNWGYRPSGAPGSAYRYGIQWDGATYSERSAANNVWYNFGASAETGTM